MSLIALDKEIRFPPVEMADEDGLLAIGGDLSRERLLFAYAMAFFHGMKTNTFFGGAPIPGLFYFHRK